MTLAAASRRGRQIVRAVILIIVGGALVVWNLDGLTRNWADLQVGASDPSLEAVEWPGTSPQESVSRARGIVENLPRWKVLSADPENGTLHATHATRWWGFVDDVHVRFAEMEQGTRITAHSQSRVGKGDLGQNARNLRELAESLRQVR